MQVSSRTPDRPAHEQAHVELLPVHSLRPDPRNARTHSARQIRQISRSISAFGMNVPVLIDAENKVVAGHARLSACKQLGWSEIPTIRLDHLSPEQVRAFAIAENKLGLSAGWDQKLLAAEFEELSALNIDLELTGFEMGEIDVLLDGSKPDPADEISPVDSGLPVSQVGDLWLLGRHRFFCGNALDRDDFKTLMSGKRARCVITDPPFNLKIDGHVSGLGAVKHREFAMASGEMSKAEFIAFLSRAFENMVATAVDGSLHYIFIDWRHLPEILAAGEANFTELINLAVWDKGCGGMGSLYRSQHELIVIWKSGKAPHTNNVQLGKHGRNRTNVWAAPGMSSFAGRAGDERNLLSAHPTAKPVSLIADAILDCTARGDVVLDPFLGSGTTLLAAERVGRVAYCMEIDPIYVDVAIRRWQRFAGENAIRADGVTFCEAEVIRG